MRGKVYDYCTTAEQLSSCSSFLFNETLNPDITLAMTLLTLMGLAESNRSVNYKRRSRQLNFEKARDHENDLDALESFSRRTTADPFDMLLKSVPGNPGQDYPVFAVAPRTGFSCEGRINGGK